MTINPEKIRQAIINVIPGVTDEDADQVVEELRQNSSGVITKRRMNRRPAPFLDAMANHTEARRWISKSDAMHDPDVILLRQLTERDRARVLLVAEGIECSVPWDGVMSREALILPPRTVPDIKAIPIKQLSESGHKFARLAAWFATSSLRISLEHKIEPEFAFGFLLLDSLWKGIPTVEVSLNQYGKEARQSRVVISADPSATEEDLLLAFSSARSALGYKEARSSKRELRSKTFALAAFFAAMISEEILVSSAVDWRSALTVWNAYCEAESRTGWVYVKTSSRNTEHQFARDVKHALEAVRGEATPYVINGQSNRKLVNKFTKL